MQPEKPARSGRPVFEFVAASTSRQAEIAGTLI